MLWENKAETLGPILHHLSSCLMHNVAVREGFLVFEVMKPMGPVARMTRRASEWLPFFFILFYVISLPCDHFYRM